MDADFVHLATNIPRLMERSDIDLLREIEDHCVAFLEKHPVQSLASREGGYILTTLCSMLQKELEGL